MSYMGLMEDELTEQCVCGKSYEDHGESQLCECGHYFSAHLSQGLICLADDCDAHSYEHDDMRYCDWSKDGSTFRRREPNDGH